MVMTLAFCMILSTSIPHVYATGNQKVPKFNNFGTFVYMQLLILHGMCMNRRLNTSLHHIGNFCCFHTGKFFIGNRLQIVYLHSERGTSLLIQNLEAIYQGNGHDGALGLHRTTERTAVEFTHGIAVSASRSLGEDYEIAAFLDFFGHVLDDFQGLPDILPIH